MLAGLAFSLSSKTALAGPELSVGKTYVLLDGTSTVPVFLRNNTNDTALQFDLVFDAGRVLSGDAVAGSNQANPVVSSFEPVPGRLRVLVYSYTNAVLANGVLVTVPFSAVNGAAVGPVALSLTNAIVSDAHASPAPAVTLLPGNVTVSATPLPHFSGVSRSAGQTQLQLEGVADLAYIIQASANLLNWIPLSTNVAVGGQIHFTDLTATNLNVRFYRAAQGP